MAFDGIHCHMGSGHATHIPIMEFEFAKSEHSEAVEALDSARKKLNAEIDERIEMAKKTLSQGPTVLDLISEREALLGLAGDISEVWV